MRSYFLFFALVLLSQTLGGCVTKTTFEQKANEAATLSDRLQQMGADYQNLQEQHNDLMAQKASLEKQQSELNDRNAGLSKDLARARADIERLEQVLSDRSAQTGAAMSEMRQTIDRLESKSRELAQQVERERIAREARLAQMKNTYDQLVDKMETEIKRGEITISELQGKLTVNMVERILFDSGQADIKKEGLEVLSRVGKILKGVTDKEVRVEGHTDNIPISSRLRETFPSNWELSTARAANVVHFLQDPIGIPGERLSANGFGEFRPVADNGDSKGRAQNRRIQMVLIPLEPQQTKTAH